jgi:DNA-binding SARP family transcriptional activator
MTARPVRVRLIGGFAVDIDGRVRQISRANDRVMRLLLALSCRGPDGASVEELTDVLWAGDPPDVAYAGLRKTVQRLRVLLGGPGAVHNTRGGYVLDPDIVSRDVDDLARLHAQTRGVIMPGDRAVVDERAHAELSLLLAGLADVQAIELADPRRAQQLQTVVTQLDDLLARVQDPALQALGGEARGSAAAALSKRPRP